MLIKMTYQIEFQSNSSLLSLWPGTGARLKAHYFLLAIGPSPDSVWQISVIQGELWPPA